MIFAHFYVSITNPGNTDSKIIANSHVSKGTFIKILVNIY